MDSNDQDHSLAVRQHRNGDLTIYAAPEDWDGRRWPWYRWIPNAYRSGRELCGLGRLSAATEACANWWASR